MEWVSISGVLRSRDSPSACDVPSAFAVLGVWWFSWSGLGWEQTNCSSCCRTYRRVGQGPVRAPVIQSQIPCEETNYGEDDDRLPGRGIRA